MAEHALPEWLIDDTAEIGDARMFAAHTIEPRLIGELIPDTEIGADELRDDVAGLTLSTSDGWTLCRIDWIDAPCFDADALCRSLRRAIRHHDAVRSTGLQGERDG